LSPERRTLRLEPRPEDLGAAEPWRGALEALGREVAALRKRVDVSVVLSNHFARYALLPAQDAASAEEELALARFQFVKIHGDRAKAWEVRVSPGHGGAALACAIDSALLQGLKSCFPRTAKARLVSVQPALMAAYNGARRRIPREGAWLVLAERERTCIARLGAKGWASVHNARETDVDGLLERERNRASGEPLPALVLRSQA
jgi:hypothetical protein